MNELSDEDCLKVIAKCPAELNTLEKIHKVPIQNDMKYRIEDLRKNLIVI